MQSNFGSSQPRKLPTLEELGVDSVLAGVLRPGGLDPTKISNSKTNVAQKPATISSPHNVLGEANTEITFSKIRENYAQHNREALEYLKGKLPDPVREALFGTGYTSPTTGKVDDGFIGWMYDSLTKSDQERYDEYTERFEGVSADAARRGEIAQALITGQEIEMTPEEARVAGSIQRSRAFWNTLESLDFVGFAGTAARKTVVEVGRPLYESIRGVRNADEATDLLRGLGVSEDTLGGYVDDVVKAQSDTEISALIKRVVDEQRAIGSVSTVPLRTADGSEPITVGGKVFNDEVMSVRKELETMLDEVGDEFSTALKARMAEDGTPTFRSLKAAENYLEQAGIKSNVLSARIADIGQTIKTEPQRFLGESVTNNDSEFLKNFKTADEYVKYVENKGNTFKTYDEVSSFNETQKGFSLEKRLENLINKNEGNEIKGIIDFQNSIKVERELIAEQEGVSLMTMEGSRAVRKIMESRYGPVVGEELLINTSESAINFADKSGMLKVTKRHPGGGIDTKATKKHLEDVWNKANAKKLDEVANPLKENLGMLNVNLQERYGKAAITKSKAEKFAANEKKVFYEVLRYVEEVRHVAENGGEMVQTMPKWIPTELREMTVLDNVVTYLQSGTLPTSHASKEMALYTTMVDEVARRSGVKAKPQKAVDAEGAIIESMQERTRKPGSKKNPVIKTAPVSDETADAANMFEEGPLDREIVSEVDVIEAYAEYAQAKAPTYKKRKKTDTNIQPPYGLKIDGPDDIGELSQFKSVFRDVYRNNEKFWGAQWGKLKEKLFDPFDAAKGKMVFEEKALIETLDRDVVKALGIKKGSKESAAVMDFGEGKVTYNELVLKFGTDKADRVVTAAKWFRGQYDRMIAELNAVETALGKKLTPNRPDYFRHFEEMSEGWTGLKNAFEGTGLENVSPGKLIPEDSRLAKGKWASFMQRRKGDQSKRDAVGGFLNYVPQYTYAKHIDPHTAKFRDFLKDLMPYKDTSSSMVNYLNGMEKWVDDLAGQANFVDRFAEYAPGGRRGLDTVDFLNKRAKRNAILGNVGASISQAFNVPGGIASAGVHSAVGLLRSLGDIMHYGDGTAPWNKSAFIMERYRNSQYDKFNVGLLENSKGFASWMITVLDEAGTKFIWNSHYEKAIRSGFAEPVKYADDMARKIVAGRGVGEVPILQKSKVFQVVAPFQLEVMNQWWLMKDFVDEKAFGKLATLFVAYYVFNEASEQIKGSKVGFDPLQAFYDSYKIMTEEGQVDLEGNPATLTDRAFMATGRMAGELLTSFPMGSYIATGATKLTGMTPEQHEMFFGDADPVRFGNAPLLWNSLNDPLFGIMPSWGGAQLEKTVGGIRALAENQVRDKDGVVMRDLPVEPGVEGVLQNILFGQYAPNFQYRDAVTKELRSLYLENQVLIENDQADLVKQNLEDLPKELHSLYREVAKEEKAKEIERDKKAMYPLYRTVTALIEEGKTTEAKTLLGKLSEVEQKVYREVHKDFKRMEDDATITVEEDAEHVIRSVIDYAYAFGTNPVQAYQIVFKDHQIIRDTVGGSFTGVVRTRRRPLKDSEAVKKQMAEEAGVDVEEVQLGHIIPSALGGREVMENYVLETPEVNKAWTDVENYLVNAVKTQRLGYREAQELILRYKGRAGQPITFEEIKALVGVAEFPRADSEAFKSQEHRGLDDIGTDIPVVGDEDYNRRKGGRPDVVGTINQALSN